MRRDVCVYQRGPLIAAELIGKLYFDNFIRYCIYNVGQVVGRISVEIATLNETIRLLNQ
jgi:hypothetical protein